MSVPIEGGGWSSCGPAIRQLGPDKQVVCRPDLVGGFGFILVAPWWAGALDRTGRVYMSSSIPSWWHPAE
jgi:hypothetical protein